MSELYIVTDSGADLPEAEAGQIGVHVVPLTVTFGQETYADRDLDSDTFWQKAQVVHPLSSQPSVGAFEQVFASLVEKGAQVLCITLTSKHSGTYSAACAAAQRFADKVAVFDSLAVSWGQRFQVEVAAQWARAGKAVEDIVATLREMRPRIALFAVVDTLEYLERGGRVAKVLPLIKRVAHTLNIKPLLTMREGEVRLLGAVNSLTRGVLRIEREVLALGALERLSVIHIRSRERAVALAQSLAEKLLPERIEIPITEAGVALSTHGGPGCVAAIALAGKALP